MKHLKALLYGSMVTGGVIGFIAATTYFPIVGIVTGFLWISYLFGMIMVDD